MGAAQFANLLAYPQPAQAHHTIEFEAFFLEIKDLEEVEPLGQNNQAGEVGTRLTRHLRPSRGKTQQSEHVAEQRSEVGDAVREKCNKEERNRIGGDVVEIATETHFPGPIFEIMELPPLVLNPIPAARSPSHRQGLRRTCGSYCRVHERRRQRNPSGKRMSAVVENLENGGVVRRSRYSSSTSFHSFVICIY
ncbi:hypothetical protein H6P81_008970 [Aristolochia fimbriata]|uniref:Uncharacterized protein n=1 Tax=Aristolochia fimbriata TaxID=158543 RepID=A0AAV7ELN9_ARIFI|nr:hypothetical protein H6P81_008970 [Aristolochia fimbriata]